MIGNEVVPPLCRELRKLEREDRQIRAAGHPKKKRKIKKSNKFPKKRDRGRHFPPVLPT